MSRFLTCVALVLIPLAGRADCNVPVIPNLHRILPLGTTMSLAWDAPGGVTNPQYEVVQQSKPDYCSTTLGSEVVVGTVSATQFTYTITPANVVAVVFVRLAADRCKTSSVVVGDSFTTPPSKPPSPTVQSNGAISVTYSDGRAQTVQFQRSPINDFSFQTIALTSSCANPKTATDTTAAPGVYYYRTLAVNSGGFASSDPIAATIGQAVPLRIASFTASPSTIANGDPTNVATLSWTTQGAETVTIQPSPGAARLNGSFTVKPTTTTTYTLTATQGSNTATATVTVEVLSLPFLNITKLLEPIVQVAGTGGGTTQYALRNVGGQKTDVTIATTGDIVTQSPSSFSLNPGAAQVITVTGSAQAEGSYLAPVVISYTASAAGPNGIRFSIPLFSTRIPSGPVTADPPQLRIDVQGEPGTNPTGTVTFTNNGTGVLNGLLSADVEWIIPQSGVVTIQPKTSGTFNFTIDRSKRPENTRPGSLAGHLKLSFLRSAGTSFDKIAQAPASQPIPSVSLVRVVDTVQNTVTIAGVPALAANEVALFVSGVGHTTTSTGTTFV